MYRIAIEKLLKWKQSKRRKPLIIEGARQVGKTWLMKEFGRQSYADTVYINFDSNSRMAELFASDLDTDRLIMGLELYVGHKIDPSNSLLVFDEVQEVPRALASLKYFYENAPQYHIVCAGSLLGIALHQGTSFPVGKVDFLKLYPLSFKEFDFTYFPAINSYIRQAKYSFFVDLFGFLLNNQSVEENDSAIAKVKTQLVEVERALVESEITATTTNIAVIGALAYYKLTNESKYRGFLSWIKKNNIGNVEKLHIDDVINLYDEIYVPIVDSAEIKTSVKTRIENILEQARNGEI